MQVKELQQKIQQLLVRPELKQEDSFTLQQMMEQFKDRSNNDELTAIDFSNLKDLFQQRWQRIKDSDLDYSYSSDPSCSIWVDLAKALAIERIFLSSISIFSRQKNRSQ